MRLVKRIVKRLAIGFGTLVFLLGALGIVGFYRGLTTLPKPPRGVRIEPLLPPVARQYLKPDNAAFYYAKAVDILQSYKQSGESTTQMEAVVAGDLSGDTKAIEHTLTDCHEALELGREGTKTGFCQMPTLNYETDAHKFVNPLRQLARLLVADGKLAERRGESDRAITNYLSVVRLGRDFSAGGPIMLKLVGASITRTGSQAIRAWALQRASSRADTENIMGNLTFISREQVPFDETLRCELWTSKQMLTQQKAFSKRVTSAYFDAAYGEFIHDAEKPFWESNVAAITQKWQMVGTSAWVGIFNRPVPRMLVSMMMPPLASMRSKAIQEKLEVEATIVVCAVEGYELANARLPNRISNLVPKFLPTVPIDPFDGKPLRYRSEGTNWVIWSVGSDLKDDNAEWHEFKYRKSSEERAGGDIFFKSTEPADDLAYYLTYKDFRGRPGRVRPSNSPADAS